MILLSQLRGRRSNATVPNTAPIQPPQAFVDNIQTLTNIRVATLNLSNKGITHFDSDLLWDGVDGWLREAFAAASNDSINLSVNALPTVDVDAILVAVVSFVNDQGGAPNVVNLSGGTNAAPTVNAIDSITIGAAGVGYLTNEALIFTGGGGAGAAGTIDTTATAITSVTITNRGSGYTSNPTVTVNTLAGTGATLTAVRKNGAKATLEDAGWTVTTN